MLDESTHPDVLRDAAQRDAVLAQLRTDSADDPYRARLVDDEIADLWNGDVPYFWCRPASVDLWSSTGRCFAGVFREPMLDRVGRAIDAMDEADHRRQEWVIRAALASRAEGEVHAVDHRPRPHSGHRGPRVDGAERRRCPTVSRSSSTRDRLLAAAVEIADILAAAAGHSDPRTNWLGLELVGDRFWQVAPLGAALGNGHCGPALFLAELSRITGVARHGELARRVVAGLPTVLDRLAGHPELGAVGSGGFAGLGGIAYALVHLAAELDDTEIAEWVAPAVELTVTAAATDAEAGVVGGTAGGLATLLAVHRDTGLASALRGAGQCADRLLGQPTAAEPGFAAGAAGIGWALLRLAAAAGAGTRYEEAGLAALRTAATATPPNRSWCRGLSGLGLAIVDSSAHVLDQGLAERAAEAIRVAAEGGALPDHSLCHGELGRLALLQAVGDEARAVVDLGRALHRNGPCCGTPNHVPSPGLLTGLAGIGHGALRLAFPDQVPSRLMLHPFTPDTGQSAWRRGCG